MAACTPSIHIFLGRPLFLLSSGIHYIINFSILSSMNERILKLDMNIWGYKLMIISENRNIYSIYLKVYRQYHISTV
jgi:hypothetical protein